jgi:hypothetical protein
MGIIPMLIVAGTIEGFVSPSDLPVSLKYTLAAGMFGLLLLYVKRKAPKPVLPLRENNVATDSSPSA